MQPGSNLLNGKREATPRKQIALVKLLLSIGIGQKEIAKAARVSQPLVARINLGDVHRGVPPLEIWARDKAGGLHRKATDDWLFDGKDDDLLA